MITDSKVSSARSSPLRSSMIAAVLIATVASIWMSAEFASQGVSPVGQVVRVALTVVLGVGAYFGIRWTRWAFITLCLVWAVSIALPVIFAVNFPTDARVVRGLVATAYAVSAVLTWISTGRATAVPQNT